MLAGQIMNRGGIAKRLIAFAKSLVGALPGGLAHVNIIAAMLFGAISGSAVAAASALGSMLSGPMEKEGYSREFSTAVNVTSSTTGLVVHASNILGVYSLASGGVHCSPLSGGLPAGHSDGPLLMLVAAIWSKYRKFPKGAKSSLGEIGRTFIVPFPAFCCWLW
ncbi:MAG: TRAP transporter large permease subunit [Bacteroidia bacterium]